MKIIGFSDLIVVAEAVVPLGSEVFLLADYLRFLTFNIFGGFNNPSCSSCFYLLVPGFSFFSVTDFSFFFFFFADTDLTFESTTISFLVNFFFSPLAIVFLFFRSDSGDFSSS